MWKRIAIISLLAAALLTFAGLSRPTSPTRAQFPAETPTFDPFATQLFTPTPIPTATPALTPQPTSNAPGCASPLPLAAGTLITVRSGVNIRAAPSVSAPWLANYQEPREFIVLSGPVCGDNFLWWQIRGHGITGWVAEGTTTLNFIISVARNPIDPDCPAPLRLDLGERIDLVTGVRIRAEPALSGLILTVAPLGSQAVVLDEITVCRDGYTWRNVRVEVVGVVYDGWMVEGSSSVEGRYYSVQTPDPSLVCQRPAPLNIGDLGRIRDPGGPPKNLRSLPGTDAPILFSLVDNVPFEVIGGPVCVGQDQWWRVRIRSTIPAAGWVMQGPAPNYWLAVVVAAPTLTPVITDTPAPLLPTSTPTPAP